MQRAPSSSSSRCDRLCVHQVHRRSQRAQKLPWNRSRRSALRARCRYDRTLAAGPISSKSYFMGNPMFTKKIRYLCPFVLLSMLVTEGQTRPIPAPRSTPLYSQISITAYGCKRDRFITPSVHLLQSNEVVATSVTSISSDVWRIILKLPSGHWFIKLTSPRCSSLLATTSIDGESREFATGLFEGDARVLDLGTNYIAGTLPFNGDTTIYASSDGSPIGANIIASLWMPKREAWSRRIKTCTLSNQPTYPVL